MRRAFAAIGLTILFAANTASARPSVEVNGRCSIEVERDLWQSMLLILSRPDTHQISPTSGCDRLDLNQEVKSGCCSHHGGVCGCDSATGHELCCDGRDSPSCGC